MRQIKGFAKKEWNVTGPEIVEKLQEQQIVRGQSTLTTGGGKGANHKTVLTTINRK